ncbi:hypothetical protein MVQ23_10930, partial [Fusobacterium necrophorum]|uniref:hypothetical protein n=1 Tax=Fusobacterium necrophorum TaxID=859 RepID=UPI00254A4530
KLQNSFSKGIRKQEPDSEESGFFLSSEIVDRKNFCFLTKQRRRVPESCPDRKQRLAPRKIGMYGNPFFLFLPFWILNGEIPLKFI